METSTEKLITVVVPVRNRAGIVERTLDSIAAQTSTDFRLVIVDNGSSDNTPEVLAKWVARHAAKPFAPIVVNEPVQSASRARNRGLAEVNTPYVMFFDSDDEMLPRHIERVAAELRRIPDTALLRWDVGFIDRDGWLTVKNPRFHNEMQLHLLHGTLSTQRYAVKTDLLRSIGGWNNDLSTWDDLELGVRLLLSNISVRKLHGEPTVMIHASDDSITGPDYSSRIAHIRRALDTIEAQLTDTENPDTAIYLDTLRARRAITAALLSREGNRDEAAKMKQSALAGRVFRRSAALRFINTVTRLFGRGGAYTTLMLLGKKAEKR